MSLLGISEVLAEQRSTYNKHRKNVWIVHTCIFLNVTGMTENNNRYEQVCQIHT